MITLTRSGIAVPPLAVGTMYWGTRVPTAVAHHLLDDALDRGASFIDTANNYPFWSTGGLGDESEECLGDWFRRRGAAGRDRVVLATKIGARPRVAGTGFDDAWGLSRQAVQKQVQGSLRRLKTDHVDVLYAHIDDHAAPLAETVGALQDVVNAGLARSIACSNMTADRLDEALAVAGDRPGYAAVQNRFTLLSRESGADLGPQQLLDDSVQRLCSDRGVTMVAYSTLLEGAYTRSDRPVPEAYRGPRTQHVLAVLHDVAVKLGVDAGQAVLSWLTHRAPLVIPVVGVSSTDQLEAAVTAVNTLMSAEEVSALEAAR